MIDYPRAFAENQVEADLINYYVLITGGGARITIDGITGERTSGAKHISWGLHNSRFSYSAGGKNIPLGAVPLQNGSMELVLLDDTYANYNWKIAVVNLYATNSYFAEDILISCFRVTNIKCEEGKLLLTLENKFQSRSKMRYLLEDKMPAETLTANNSMINVYKAINQHMANFGETRLDQDCLNSSLTITQVGDMTYREQLADLAQLACSGMLLRTAYDTANSGFHFAPVDFTAYDPSSDAGIQNGKAITSTGEIADSPNTSVTGFIPVDFSKSYIFDFGNVFNNLRFNLYDDTQSLIHNGLLSDYSTANGKGYVILSENFVSPSATGYIQITLPTENISEMYFRSVDHIMKNWASLQVDYPVTPTAIRYCVGGTDDIKYTNLTELTALNPISPSVTQNHLYVVNTLSSFNSIPSKERDLYAIVNGNIIERVELSPAQNPVTWQANKTIIMAHGDNAQWFKNFVHVGDIIRYDSVEGTFSVNNASQEYIIDLTDNNTMKSLSVTYGTQAVAQIANKIIGKSFRPFSGNYLNFPFIEPFDTVGIIDRYGNVYFSFATDITFAPYGATQISNNAKLATID